MEILTPLVRSEGEICLSFLWNLETFDCFLTLGVILKQSAAYSSCGGGSGGEGRRCVTCGEWNRVDRTDETTRPRSW